MNVLFIVFNRPDLTSKVFERIREAKPDKLYIASDGARNNSPDDIEKISRVRTIINRIDWKCKSYFLLHDINLGCKNAVSEAINWFFEHETEGIILEDDCLPDLSFFPYCEELLVRYRNDPQVFLISGANFIPNYNLEFSYAFSRLVLIWGWATWKRAWQHYNDDMNEWKMYAETDDLDYFGKQKDSVFRRIDEEYYYNKSARSWGVQWRFQCLLRRGLSIVPKSNLVQNLGFGRPDATRQTKKHKISDAKIESLIFPLKHPERVDPSKKFDEASLEYYFGISEDD